MEPTVVHVDLVSRHGALLAPESSVGSDGSQQQALSRDSEVPLLLKQVSEQALEQEQHILDPHSEKLFDAPSEEQPAVEPAADTEGTKATPEPE
ncbi:unnamed protein product [Caretta caretta]